MTGTTRVPCHGHQPYFIGAFGRAVSPATHGAGRGVARRGSSRLGCPLTLVALLLLLLGHICRSVSRLQRI